jgi:hypothetical protein
MAEDGVVVGFASETIHEQHHEDGGAAQRVEPFGAAGLRTRPRPQLAERPGRGARLESRMLARPPPPPPRGGRTGGGARSGAEFPRRCRVAKRRLRRAAGRRTRKHCAKAHGFALLGSLQSACLFLLVCMDKNLISEVVPVRRLRLGHYYCCLHTTSGSFGQIAEIDRTFRSLRRAENMVQSRPWPSPVAGPGKARTT